MERWNRRTMIAGLIGAGCAAPFAARAQGDEGPYQIARTTHWRIKRGVAPDLTIWASWPDGDAPKEGWPLAMILDGDDNFPIAALALRRMGRGRGAAKDGARDGVLIGLSSGTMAQRIFDYTPVVAGYTLPKGVPGGGARVGGAGAFLDLVDQQVLPRVIQRWPVDPARRTMIGHSFGGLLALYAGMAGWGGATRLAAISPSGWYGNGLLSDMAGHAPKAPIRALIAGGEQEAWPTGNSGQGNQALSQTLAQRWADVRWKSLGALPHGATMQAALGDALNLAMEA